MVEIAIYIVLLLICAPLLGRWMARVFQRENYRPVERWMYRLIGVDPAQEMNWKQYMAALVVFNVLGCLAVLGLLLTQAWLPLNPQKFPNLSLHLAFNTAVSFMTNTNWQSYSGESTLGYLPQMLGLAVQNFLSAATGLAAMLAITRGLARRTATTIGNFWVDLTRSTVYVLLPLAVVYALVLASQGVVQTFAPYATAKTLAGVEQTIPLGPAASQIAIKQIGTNGGGFFGLNSAHPFENPTPLSNFLECFAILLLPASLVLTYGHMLGKPRQGWAIFAAMLVLFVVGLGVALCAEYQPNPVLGPGAAMEGKEQRFGVAPSVLWATATTDTSNGSVDCMHDSLSPLAGLVTISNILLGEVVFGGVGVGMKGVLMMVILTVFLAGLMVGRSPEYLGKKVEGFEVTMAMISVLTPCAVVLVFGALGAATEVGRSSLNNTGPHGLTEILYAFASPANNNGSAFAGLNANTPFYDWLGAIAMLIGRFVVILPGLAIAGSMVKKKIAPPSSGTFPTDGPLFVGLLIGVIIIVASLTFFPVLSLGPIVEHFLMNAGRSF
jgi:K+-transporting ATPase ATPase A chain